jgi:hypothetical protein
MATIPSIQNVQIMARVASSGQTLEILGNKPLKSRSEHADRVVCWHRLALTKQPCSP